MRPVERARAILAVVWLLASASVDGARQIRRRAPGTRFPARMRGGVRAVLGEPGSVDRGQTNARGTAKAAAGIVGSVGLVGLVEQYGLGGILYATFLEIIGGIQSFGTTITAPFEAFGEGVANLVSAVIPVRIVNAAADFTAFSITRGEWAIFGPFTFAVGVAATVAGLWVFLEIVSRAQIGLFGSALSRLRNNS